MKTIDLMEKLKKRPIFKVQDVERLAYCSREYAKLIVNRLKKRGYVTRVMRNVYTTKSDIFVVASNIVYPSYISFWSAACFLGYTEQIVNTISVATTRKIRPLKFEGYTIRFVPLKHFFGYRKMTTSEGDIFVAEDEKLIIDAFLRPSECGNFDEIQKIFKNANISKNKIVGYLKMVNNNSIAKKIGFLLEKTKNIDIADSFRLDNNYPVLNPFAKEWKKRSSKWRLRI